MPVYWLAQCLTCQQYQYVCLYKTTYYPFWIYVLGKNKDCLNWINFAKSADTTMLFCVHVYGIFCEEFYYNHCGVLILSGFTSIFTHEDLLYIYSVFKLPLLNSLLFENKKAS